MKSLQFGWSHYWAPTPKNIRKIADSVVVACTFSGGISSLNGHPIIGTGIFVLGFLAKIISNFFTDETNTNT